MYSYLCWFAQWKCVAPPIVVDVWLMAMFIAALWIHHTTMLFSISRWYYNKHGSDTTTWPWRAPGIVEIYENSDKANSQPTIIRVTCTYSDHDNGYCCTLSWTIILPTAGDALNITIPAQKVNPHRLETLKGNVSAPEITFVDGLWVLYEDSVRVMQLV